MVKRSKGSSKVKDDLGTKITNLKPHSNRHFELKSKQVFSLIERLMHPLSMFLHVIHSGEHFLTISTLVRAYFKMYGTYVPMEGSSTHYF